MKPLKNSIIAKTIEKIKIDEKSFLNLNIETTKVMTPKNKPKKEGIKINANGISGLKVSSKVSE